MTARNQFTRVRSASNVPPAGRWQPEESAGWLSHVLYTYCNGLLALGARKVLMQDDLWAVSRRALRNPCPAPDPDPQPNLT